MNKSDKENNDDNVEPIRPPAFAVEFYRMGGSMGGPEDTRWNARILRFEEDGMEMSDRLRLYADGLKEISRKMMEDADKLEEGEEPDHMMTKEGEENGSESGDEEQPTDGDGPSKQYH